ncbi:MAG TPA: sigma-70 family RNA polymerase sigma factor [Acidimicrobiales bacterium]
MAHGESAGDGNGDGDAALLARASRDAAAFEAIYRRYVRRVTAFAARRCTRADDVADVVAQTFLRLIEAADRYDPARGEPAPFVLGIAANVAREVHRSHARTGALTARLAGTGRDLLDPDESERIEAAIDAAHQARGLGEALDGISPAEQDVLRLVAAGHTPGQAAAELGISAGAARVRLSRARRRVRDQISGAASPATPIEPGANPR